VIGLSGLITPSLDEMVTVAKEMERAELNVPLMIGGATTSRVHTAVKIEEHFTKDQTVHVLDASRSVTVVESLLGPKKEVFVSNLREEYAKVRENHTKNRAQKKMLSLDDARRNKYSIDWSNFEAAVPHTIGLQNVSVETEDLLPYIDWTPFFRTWELHGKYPAILEDEVVGAEAKKLLADAQGMLNRIQKENWLTHKGVVGIFPANAVEDDIELYDDNGNTIHTTSTMRQQLQKASGVPNIALSDFIAPKETGKTDYLGGFVVTSGIGIESKIEAFEADHDDYNSILLKALADRLAEAFAEYLHERVRKEIWGYAKEESLDNEALIKEAYRGIRPAPGYPACPDHTEKIGLFQLLEAEKRTGVSLTDSLAMYPTASVSGWYFAHPESKYFGVGRITMEQVASLSKRKGFAMEDMERWLSPNLH
jgi:5-methyltetrahydrofolate--homocysteine methyltransferase